MQADVYDEYLTILGFDLNGRFDVQGLYSIAHFFNSRQRKCGIYMFQLADGTYYIGQAKNVVRRFHQHKKNHDSIERIWFRLVSQRQLNEVETWCIQTAESLGLPIINKTFVSNYRGEAELDDLISEEEQHLWLASDEILPGNCERLCDSIDERLVLKYRHRFNDITKFPEYPLIKGILRLYISRCLPAYNCTEQAFWSLSCMPSTNAGSWPRLVCMNVNAMETMVLGYQFTSGKPFAFVNVVASVLDQDNTIDALQDRFPDLSVDVGNYRTAGYDQIRLNFESYQQLVEAMTDYPMLVSAMKQLNLRLMRKGGTVFYPYHCFDLVRDVMS